MANPCPSLAELGTNRSLSNGRGKYKFGQLMRVETYPNGGGKVLHMWQDEINALRLPEADLERIAEEFLHVSYIAPFQVAFLLHPADPRGITWEVYQEFPPSHDILPRVDQTTGSVHPPAYTAQLLTLH